MENPTAIVAEDEPALMEWLVSQLKLVWPELRIVGLATDGLEAQRLLDTIRPDFVFLDIRLPERTGLEVALNHQHPCQIIFVTAYDQYAVEAFEAGAVDYLLKPVSEERLAVTVERLKKRNRRPEGDAALAELVKTLVARQQDRLEWIQALRGDEIVFVPIDEVILFQSSDKFTVCHTGDEQYLLRTPLKDLEVKLDPDRYWRVHRNSIVRVASIERVKRDILYGVVVYLRGIKTPVPVSQTNVKRFHSM